MIVHRLADVLSERRFELLSGVHRAGWGFGRAYGRAPGMGIGDAYGFELSDAYHGFLPGGGSYGEGTGDFDYPYGECDDPTMDYAAGSGDGFEGGVSSTASPDIAEEIGG